MQNKLEWTDLYGSSFNVVKIADLLEGNPHTYNHKVVYTTIKKKIWMGTLITNLGYNALLFKKSKSVLSVLSSLKLHHRG